MQKATKLLVLAALAFPTLTLTACGGPSASPDPSSSSSPSAIQGRANSGVPTTMNSPGASPTNDSNSASAPGGPGTGSVTRR